MTLGLQTATDAEIVGGLKEGELVVYGEQSHMRRANLLRRKS